MVVRGFLILGAQLSVGGLLYLPQKPQIHIVQQDRDTLHYSTLLALLQASAGCAVRTSHHPSSPPFQTTCRHWLPAPPLPTQPSRHATSRSISPFRPLPPRRQHLSPRSSHPRTHYLLSLFLISFPHNLYLICKKMYPVHAGLCRPSWVFLPR